MQLSTRLLSYLFLILANFALCYGMNLPSGTTFIPVACNSSIITNSLIKLNLSVNIIADKNLQSKNMYIYFGNSALVDAVISNHLQHLITNKKHNFVLILVLDEEFLKEMFAFANLDFNTYKEEASNRLTNLPMASEQEAKQAYTKKLIGKFEQILNTHDYSCMACIINMSTINFVDSDGASPIFYAASKNNLNTLSALIEFGANINLPDKAGNTPLHWAAYNGSKDTCLALLKMPSINVLAKDEKNKSALDYAKEVYYRLKNKADKTQDELAKMRDCQEVGQMLIKHLALYTQVGLISKKGIMGAFNDSEIPNGKQELEFVNTRYANRLFHNFLNNIYANTKILYRLFIDPMQEDSQRVFENQEAPIILPKEIAERIAYFLVNIDD